MSEERIELTDGLLGAYVDGELDADDAARVEALASADASVRRRLAAIRKVTQLVGAAVITGGESRASVSGSAPVARSHESAPGTGASCSRRFRRFALRKGGLSAWNVAAAFMAGVLVLLAVFELADWHAVDAVDWREEVLAFHDMYLRAGDNEPRDAMLAVPSGQPADVARLIDFSPALPDLAAHGYGPAGAHLLSAASGPVVYFLFESPERPPIGFAMTRNVARSVSQNETSQAINTTAAGLSLVSWSSGPFEYGLGGQVPASELLPIVETVRSALPSMR
jgi:anti-sigma factor RsiW